MSYLFFFFNDTATTEIYTLSLHDALPILHSQEGWLLVGRMGRDHSSAGRVYPPCGALHTDDVYDGKVDRKSTRLNSSHTVISYAVFCLKKKTTSASPQQGPCHQRMQPARP